jgi:aminocarboxymuconate-semialdehyde decarboxylase
MMQNGPSRVVDVHAHYIPPDAPDMMTNGRAAVSMHVDAGVPGCIALNGMRVGATIDQLSSVESMLTAMDDAGIDMRVLSPPPFTYRYWSDPEEALALHRRLNEATAEVVEAHPDRFTGLAIAPLQAPELAVAELRRGVEALGLRGLTVGTNVDGRNLSADGPSAVLRAAEELDVSVLIHPDFVPNERLGDHYLVNLVGMPTETATALANLVLSGRLEELGRLRLCVVHGGGSFPYLLGRLDKGWQVRPETRACIGHPPSEGLRNVYFDTLTHAPLAVRYRIDLVGSDNVVIGSDSPFDVEEPQPLRRLREVPGLTSEEERTIAEISPRRWLEGEGGEVG